MHWSLKIIWSLTPLLLIPDISATVDILAGDTNSIYLIFAFIVIIFSLFSYSSYLHRRYPGLIPNLRTRIPRLRQPLRYQHPRSSTTFKRHRSGLHRHGPYLSGYAFCRVSWLTLIVISRWKPKMS